MSDYFNCPRCGYALNPVEELAMLVRRQVISEHQNNSKKLPKQQLDKWRGFLPRRVDALEFQQELRREWDDRGVSVSLTE